jgi:uncharacterized OB-fold protein
MPVTEHESDEQEEGVEVECQNCGYVWVYSGEMWQTTCPRCNRKTPTGLAPEDE